MFKKIGLFCGLLFLFSELGYSSSQVLVSNIDIVSPCPLNAVLRPYIVATFGPDFMRSSRAQYLTVVPGLTNYYTSTSPYKTSGGLGLGGGLEGYLFDGLFWQLGLSAFYNTRVENRGDVLDFGSQLNKNFSYRYTVQSSRIVATGKFLSTYRGRVHPYFSGELGSAFNASQSYNEIALNSQGVALPPFVNHTQNYLTWGIGAGVDVDMNSTFRLGLGYQFVDLGEAKLGLSSIQTMGQASSLTVPHMYDNQIRFQITTLV